MKKILFTTLLFGMLFICISSFAQCPPGNLTLTTQAEVNNFTVQYPNCTEMTGILKIEDYNASNPDITDLSALANLVSVGGLEIYTGALTSLNGVDNLQTIGSTGCQSKGSLRKLK